MAISHHSLSIISVIGSSAVSRAIVVPRREDFSGAQSGKWCMTDGGGYDNSSVGYPRGKDERRRGEGSKETEEEKEEKEEKEARRRRRSAKGPKYRERGTGRAGGRRTFAPSRWSSPRVIELGRIGRTILRLPSLVRDSSPRSFARLG